MLQETNMINDTLISHVEAAIAKVEAKRSDLQSSRSREELRRLMLEVIAPVPLQSVVLVCDFYSADLEELRGLASELAGTLADYLAHLRAGGER